MADLVGLDPVRRSFARLFFTLRTRAQVTQDRAAKELELGRATILRLETAEDGVKLPVRLVDAMADLFGADDKERQLLLALAAETRNGRQQSWWQNYTSSEVPAWFSLYLSLEEFAKRIRVHFGDLLPGLVQEPAYARAVISVPPGREPREEVERRVESRLHRQRLLERSSVVFEAIGSEGALHRMVGGADTMRRQLERILRLTERDNASVRIIPFGTGVHAGMAASDFTLLDFPETATAANGNGSAMNDSIAEPALAYVETFTGAMYTQTVSDVEAYDAVWKDLKERALTADDSRALIEERLKEMMRSKAQERSR
ncbi:helix-turn-helix transcriptional regulator [Micromonospora sp. WMMA1363]|uniref:helix-turn-helix domain-containing protein n=1 Tax=Micromonospora sp. WMMA1363 TaxID=3053985 RepID=UPI00259CA595|nr:helix-turn-helix transcriptional regulator [Micromonospora sp. WMMA1363]MDM4723282.1 helix-turn-helix transcriptional regulator [Micromonospora sp. WMMA1363]MDM4723376.1 helix-turn-helix transcriptional regulator [Micromonospora sp. WMMA1363]